MKAFGASTAPLSGTWNIQSSGKATSSGELTFRVTPRDGSDPIEVTVAVSSGTTEEAAARKIRTTLGSQLRSDRYDVQMGQGANVLVTDAHRQPNFSLELVDSDVENLRVTVQSTTPVAPPTVPQQSVPATPPALIVPAKPDAPGDAEPPATAPPQSVPPATNDSPAPGSQSPDAPPPQKAPPPVPDGEAAPTGTSGAGAPEVAPPMGPTTSSPVPPGTR